jgi:hypothetical protein
MLPSFGMEIRQNLRSECPRHRTPQAGTTSARQSSFDIGVREQCHTLRTPLVSITQDLCVDAGSNVKND